MQTCEGLIMYRLTRNRAKQIAICKRMREGKEAKRQALARDLGPRPAIYQPPELRRVVIVIDYNTEPKIDIYRMTKTNRIDSYEISKNGEQIKGAGWANFCKRLSVHYPRVLSDRNY